MLQSPIHCCDVTKPPYLLSGELCTSPLHSNRLYMYTVCCRRGGQCFSVLRTRHIDVVGDSSGRSYVTEQGHSVPLLRTRGLLYAISVIMEPWSVQHRAFVVEAYFKNGDSVVRTQRLFRRNFHVARHGPIPSRNIILRWYRTSD